VLLLTFGVGHAGTATAQGESETEPALSVSAICAYEFANAAERVRSVAVAATTETGTSRPEGSPAPERSSAPDAQDGRADGTTTPLVTQIGDTLDAAIRSCASVEEWLTASILFPEALDPSDAQAVLTARCGDPSTGLDAFATCRSLAVALAAASATPAPTAPSATPTVSDPAVEPTARPAGTGPGATAKPTTSGRKAGKKQRVTVSKKQKATIPGATEIRYFNIKGDSPAQLLKQNQKRASRHCGNHRAIACVLMTWQISVTRKFDPDTNACTIGKASTTLRSIVYLPRWTTRGRAGSDLVDWWHRVLLQSAVHEAQHIKIQQRHLADFRRAAAGKACGRARIISDRHSAKAEKAQAAFDRVEYQKLLPPLPQSLLR
jgi:predicted secreted Zn-dependent protease